MDTATEAQDNQVSPHEEAFQTVREALGNIMRNIENKTGNTSGLTKALDLQIELSKVIDAGNVKELHVTWAIPDSWGDPE